MYYNMEKDHTVFRAPVQGFTINRDNQFDGDSALKAVRKLRFLILLGCIVGVLTIVAGAVTLGVAAENIGFPIFNFGILLVGIVFTIGYVIGFWKISTAIQFSPVTEDSLKPTKCAGILVFVISVTCVSLASVAGVFSLLAGISCAGDGIVATIKNGGHVRYVNTKQFCYPNIEANTALGFIDAVLCLVMAILCILVCVFVCAYGRYFGFRNRRRY